MILSLGIAIGTIDRARASRTGADLPVPRSTFPPAVEESGKVGFRFIETMHDRFTVVTSPLRWLTVVASAMA